MSLLLSLQDGKKHLNSCSTVVTKLSGEKCVETIDVNGRVTETQLATNAAGYVIDLHPDLQVVHVSPFLLLGSQDVASDAGILGKEFVTDIISIGVTPCKLFKRIHYEMIDLLDLPESNLLEALKKTNQLIDSVRERERKVLVHCNAGCSRAPAIVIGYLMYSQHLRYDAAYQFIANQRSIRPNDGFIRQLHLYQEQVCITDT